MPTKLLPTRSEYATVLNNLDSFIIPEELREYLPVRTKTGLPRIFSGGCVLAVPIANQSTGTMKALRLFNVLPIGISQRYAEITPFIHRHLLTGYFVPVNYYSAGVVVNGQTYPIVVMNWVDGITMDSYIRSNVTSSNLLHTLRDRFVAMMRVMRSIGVAHGSLSGENILVNPDGTLVLIDYDGMFVPRLRGLGPCVLGHPNFEHPQRFEGAYRNYFGQYQDNFASIVLYLTLMALISNPSLHERYNEDGRILFRRSDFVSPDASPLLQEMSADQELVPLVERFRLICKRELNSCPSLDEFLDFEAAIHHVLGAITLSEPASPDELTANIFISYRRLASPHFAPRLADELRKRTHGDVFIDVESLGVGAFWSEIRNAIANCDYFILVISPGTLDKSRLSNEKDTVRREINEALQLGKKIIQVVEDRTEFASADQLPPELAPLAEFNGVRIYDDSFRRSVDNLMDKLRG